MTFFSVEEVWRLNAGIRPSVMMCCYWCCEWLRWRQIADDLVRQGKQARACRAFEMSGAYMQLLSRGMADA